VRRACLSGCGPGRDAEPLDHGRVHPGHGLIDKSPEHWHPARAVSPDGELRTPLVLQGLVEHVQGDHAYVEQVTVIDNGHGMDVERATAFWTGANHPEELVEADERDLEAVAITDHDGLYGVVRFAAAARDLGVRTVYGAELSIGLSALQNGIPDPQGEHLLLLAAGWRATGGSAG
jgi:hypothetical protein